MISLIKFSHLGKQITANAIFNYNQNQNAVLVESFGCKEELGEKILLVKDEGKWTTDSTIPANFRSTYLNILTEINWLFRQNNVH